MPLAHELLDWLRAPGWRGHLLALIAGALTTLSFTPFDIWPLGLLSIALLYQGLQRLGGRQALWRGWCWGLGLFLSGVSWIYISIHVPGSAAPALAALLTGGLVAGLALIPALTAWLWARWLRPQSVPGWQVSASPLSGSARSFFAAGSSPAFPGCIRATPTPTPGWPAGHRLAES